jgi:alkanesulfonate monooxygenase SsuD/methylene tetrahydromethanopterin reductase-like flavin-dependent oxidoreductase (luciferase family)
LFTGQQVHFDGRFSTVDGLRLDPLPVQRPGPPVWVGGRSEAAMRRAGRFADVWLPYMYTPERLAGSLSRVRENAAGFGREDVVRGAIFSWSCVDADGGWARRSAVETLNGIYNQDFEPLADRYLPTGKPQQVIERFGEYAQAGAESVVFSPACAPEYQDRVIDTFASEVLPALRDL